MHRFAIHTALLAALCAGQTMAESPTPDPTTAHSARSRAEVQAELSQFRAQPNPWSTAYDPLARFQSQLTRQQVRAAAIASRDGIQALTGEDSGSFALGRSQAAAHLASATAHDRTPALQ